MPTVDPQSSSVGPIARRLFRICAVPDTDVLIESLLAAFSSYGGFWLSFATLYLPGAGIVDAYGDNASELNSALGIYLITWFLFTTLML